MLKFSAAKRLLLSALVLAVLMVFLVSASLSSFGAISQAGVSDHPAAVIACVADDPGSSGGGCGGG